MTDLFRSMLLYCTFAIGRHLVQLVIYTPSIFVTNLSIIYIYIFIPVVLHKAVAEVSKIGNYRRGELLRCMDGKANPLMDPNVVVIFGVVAMVTSPTTAE